MAPKVTVVIQARMGSSRLPGKVLMEVKGKSLLSYLIEQLSYSVGIEDVILATTKNEIDDVLEEAACKEGLKCYRGSELDVLDRYYQAAKLYGMKHIMRITADCPLNQPDICDHAIQSYFETNADYVYTNASYAEGVSFEIVKFKILAQIWSDAKLQSEREHVTLYIHNHPDLFHILELENETEDGKYRITVDNEEDFRVVKKIIEEIYLRKNSFMQIQDIKTYLDRHPEIHAINAHIIRNEGLIESLKKDREV